MSSEASKHLWYAASLKSRFKFAGAGWTLALLSPFVGATRRVAPTSGQPLSPESVKKVPGTFFVPGTFLSLPLKRQCQAPYIGLICLDGARHCLCAYCF